MSVTIQLAQRHAVYTNVDNISGRVILFLNREESFTAIKVKLEGESRTRLAHPLGTRMGDRGEFEIELHKVLYNIATVFPTNSVFGAKAYTLPAGSHEFNFSFKIPFNNTCSPQDIKTLSLAGLNVDVRDANQHVRRTLPPSLSGFPGEADIKYFVKVTAERPSLLKENFRAIVPFIFLPIEPPRPPPNNRETYGRRKHQFSEHNGPPSRTGYFRKPAQPSSGTPPSISVDVRLPDPTIITSNETLPLRVLVTKLNDSTESIFLRTFHVTLWGHTRVRAHELSRVEITSWVICSYANMMEKLLPEGSTGSNTSPPSSLAGPPTPAAPAGTPDGPGVPAKDGVDNSLNLYPMLVPSRLWERSVLPSSVPPSFETCNLARWYELEISVGLSWGSSKATVRPELTVQAIRLPVSVYSGIAPSPALVSAANAAAASSAATQQQDAGPSSPLLIWPAASSSAGVAASSQGLRPQGRPPPTQQQQQQRPQQPPDSVDPGAAGPSSNQAATIPAPPYDDPPPSYEDTLAEDIAPVDGPRREYHVAESEPIDDPKRRR